MYRRALTNLERIPPPSGVSAEPLLCEVSLDDGDGDGVVLCEPSRSSHYMLLFIYITMPSPNYAEVMIFPVTGFAEIEYSFVMK